MAKRQVCHVGPHGCYVCAGKFIMLLRFAYELLRDLYMLRHWALMKHDGKSAGDRQALRNIALQEQAARSLETCCMS